MQVYTMHAKRKAQTGFHTEILSVGDRARPESGRGLCFPQMLNGMCIIEQLSSPFCLHKL